jgi:hypothetical protein
MVSSAFSVMAFFANRRLSSIALYANIPITNTYFRPYKSPNLATIKLPITMPTRKDEPKKPK